MAKGGVQAARCDVITGSSRLRLSVMTPYCEVIGCNCSEADTSHALWVCVSQMHTSRSTHAR